LICYLWPLLIVLFSGLLPGETLQRGHVIGALMGFAGAALLVAGAIGPVSGALAGYAVAFVAAFTWTGYSLGSRRFGSVPTAAVAVYCLATAVLSGLAHLATETPAWPDSGLGWLAVLGLGLGPVGLAFYTWDLGVKHGDIQVLGTAAYAAPLFSTLILVLAGLATASPSLAVATVLIAGGAALATRANRASQTVRRSSNA
jgi:drug/metabolite transporter (DMT)-like permease